MRIGVDAGVLQSPSAGIARYLVNMLRAMMTVDEKAKFLLYSSKPVSPDLPGDRWSVHIGGAQWLPRSEWLQRASPKLIAGDRIDVFWGQGIVPYRVRTSALRVVTVHDLTAWVLPRTMALGSRIAARRHLRLSMEAADAVVADSHSTARQVVRLFSTDPAKVYVIPPGVPSEMRQTRTKHVVPEVLTGAPPRYILWVGTIEPRKGLDTLLAAVRTASDLPPLLVAGRPGWGCSSLMSTIRELELSGRVTFTAGPSDHQLRAYYAGALVTVCPSKYEGFGFPVLEAMHNGCPVVCSWSSSLTEVGGGAVRYFRSGDVSGLSEVLRHLVVDDHERQTMALSGRLRSLTFDYDCAARDLLRLFRGRGCALSLSDWTSCA